jgi:hypothetical protein
MKRREETPSEGREEEEKELGSRRTKGWKIRVFFLFPEINQAILQMKCLEEAYALGRITRIYSTIDLISNSSNRGDMLLMFHD